MKEINEWFMTPNGEDDVDWDLIKSTLNMVRFLFMKNYISGWGKNNN